MIGSQSQKLSGKASIIGMQVTHHVFHMALSINSAKNPLPSVYTEYNQHSVITSYSNYNQSVLIWSHKDRIYTLNN